MFNVTFLCFTCPPYSLLTAYCSIHSLHGFYWRTLLVLMLFCLEHCLSDFLVSRTPPQTIFGMHSYSLCNDPSVPKPHAFSFPKRNSSTFIISAFSFYSAQMMPTCYPSHILKEAVLFFYQQSFCMLASIFWQVDYNFFITFNFHGT